MKEKEPQTEKGTQTTDTVLMIYPDTFTFNPETAASNSFMKKLYLKEEEINSLARKEFSNAVNKLRESGINVFVVHSPEGKETPDAVFPNNWISFHEDKLITYPMRNPSRSIERQPEKILEVLQKADIQQFKILDLSYHEQFRDFENGMSVCTEALEGTGSMVLDRQNKIAYAIESPRTAKVVFNEWCTNMGFTGILFHGENANGPIYHTNVIMGIGEKFAVFCSESVQNLDEREKVIDNLSSSGKIIVDISLEQVDAFCGNILQLKDTSGKSKIVMSQTAYNAFSEDQLQTLAQFGEIITLDIPTIESAGGSARCILAEIFYRPKFRSNLTLG